MKRKEEGTELVVLFEASSRALCTNCAMRWHSGSESARWKESMLTSKDWPKLLLIDEFSKLRDFYIDYSSSSLELIISINYSDSGCRSLSRLMLSLTDYDLCCTN